jgi:antitoxin component HigA of HigAB toxin-antitoxin module
MSTSTILTDRYRELIDLFPLRQIRTKADAAKATKILDELFSDHYEDAGEEEYVFMLAMALGDYEDKHLPVMEDPSPASRLRFMMDQHDMSQADLAKTMAVSVPTVSMILSGARVITTDNARKLGQIFGTNAGFFV